MGPASVTSPMGCDAAAAVAAAPHASLFVCACLPKHADLDKTLLSDRNKAKGLVRVPRLDGGLMGVLGTRSPHRPNPIGLSSAQVLAVDGRGVLLGGADIVDGSPVVDIKPYVPFCDALHAATCPPWVAADAGGEEPLAMKAVNVTPAAERQVCVLRQCRAALVPLHAAAAFRCLSAALTTGAGHLGGC